MDLGLSSRIAIVTGAGSGIGAAIARAFCAEKVETVFVDIDGKGLEAAAKGLRRHAACKVCDVSEKDQVERLFSEIKREYGALHILVNCAAIGGAGWVCDLREETIDTVVRVNIKGYIYTTMQAIPLMKEAGFGRLIYLNSSSGLKASAGLPLYSASKYFDRGFAVSTALEVGAYNITANSICPSDIYPEGETGAKSWNDPSLLEISLFKEGADTLESLIEKRVKKNPMKRSCTLDDVAWLALFLASERSGFINGQSIGLNGGQLPY